MHFILTHTKTYENISTIITIKTRIEILFNYPHNDPLINYLKINLL